MNSKTDYSGNNQEIICVIKKSLMNFQQGMRYMKKKSSAKELKIAKIAKAIKEILEYPPAMDKLMHSKRKYI